MCVCVCVCVCVCDFAKKIFDIGLYSVRDWFVSSVVLWYRLLSCTFWYQFGWSWSSFKGIVVKAIENFGGMFLANLIIDFNEICCHNMLVSKSSYYICFAQVIFKGKNSGMILGSIRLTWSCVRTLRTDLFRTWLMLSTTKLFSLVPVWMTLMFIEDQRFIKKLELEHSLCCKVARSNSSVDMVHCVRKTTVKEVLKVW